MDSLTRYRWPAIHCAKPTR